VASLDLRVCGVG